jgi:hypothetical protein
VFDILGCSCRWQFSVEELHGLIHVTLPQALGPPYTVLLSITTHAAYTSSKLTLSLLHGPPPPREQDRAPHFVPRKLHVTPLPKSHNIHIHEPRRLKEFLDAIDRKVRHHNRVVHLLLELGGLVVDVVFRFLLAMVVMMMRMFMFLSMPMSVVMSMPMRMDRMIPLTPLDLFSLLIRQHISALQKVINHQHATRPKPQLQLRGGVHHVLEVVEPKAHGRDVEAVELRAGERRRRRIGFVEKVAVRGRESGGEGGGRHARVVGADHVGGDVDATGDGDVRAESLYNTSIANYCMIFQGKITLVISPVPEA